MPDRLHLSFSRLFLGCISVLFASLGLAGCAQNRVQNSPVDPNAIVAGQTVDNATAVVGHMARMRAVDTAAGMVGAADPTGGRVAGPLAMEVQKKAYEASHEKMLDDSMKRLTPDQRVLMKNYMRGELTEEEFRREMFATQSLDAEGKPLKTD